MPTTLIQSHTIRYSSNALPQSILLYNEQAQVGVLQFHPNAANLPADRQAGDTVVLNYHVEDFTNVLKVLKTEEPVYLLYTGSDRGSDNGIVTGNPEEYKQAKKVGRKKK